MPSIKELIAAKKKELAKNSGGFMDVAKPPAGKSTWRILPGWKGGDEQVQFWHDFGKHFVKSEARGKSEVIIGCNAKTYEKIPCEVCYAIKRGMMGASEAQKEVLKESNASQKFLVNALHVNGPEDKRNTPVILELGKQLFEQLLEIADEYDDFYDLENGTDMLITREGTGMNTEYKMTPARRSKPVDPSVMEKINNLDEEIEKEFRDLKEAASNAQIALGKVVGLLPPAASGAGTTAGGAKDIPALPSDFDDDVDDDAGSMDMDASEAAAIDAELAEDDDSLDDELAGLDDLLGLDDVG